VKDCQVTGPEVCSTQYESECWTKNEEHNVSTIHPSNVKKVWMMLREMKKPMRMSSKKDTVAGSYADVPNSD
jgi:hypothetical protein